jgi:hypothetical protein
MRAFWIATLLSCGSLSSSPDAAAPLDGTGADAGTPNPVWIRVRPSTQVLWTLAFPMHAQILRATAAYFLGPSLHFRGTHALHIQKVGQGAAISKKRERFPCSTIRTLGESSSSLSHCR